MVSQNPERRSSAEYSLERVRELARSGLVGFGSTRVELDTENLGYDLAGICRCLEALNRDCFRHAERHTTAAPWLDVFRLSWPAPSGMGIDDLYIKLRLRGDCCFVFLASFHRDR